MQLEGIEEDGGAVATIEPSKNGKVPVLLWDIEPSDEVALDRYEGYPWLYRKEIITAIFEGESIEKEKVYKQALLCFDKSLGNRVFSYWWGSLLGLKI